MADLFDGATGALARYVQGTPEQDELLLLCRLGIKFARQHHIGGHPGFLRNYITGIVDRMAPPITFNRFLDMLALEAARRDTSDTGKNLPPVISVNRVWGVMAYAHPRRGEVQTTFGNLRNILSKAKKKRMHRDRHPMKTT